MNMSSARGSRVIQGFFFNSPSRLLMRFRRSLLPRPPGPPVARATGRMGRLQLIPADHASPFTP
jgi:hypothetical protein